MRRGFFQLLLAFLLLLTVPVWVRAQATAIVLDDFEAKTTRWQPGKAPTYQDSSAQKVALTTEHATGTQAVALHFSKTETPKAIFLVEQPIDLSQAPMLEFDLFNPGTAAEVAIALSTGSSWEWHESASAPLKQGAQTVAFDLTGNQYKTARSNWAFGVPVAKLAETQRLALIIIPTGDGVVYLDNLRLTPAMTSGAITPQAIVIPTPTATPVRTAKAATKVTLAPPTTPARQYRPLDLTLITDGMVANPFDPAQLDLRVRFTSPTGQVFLIPAFWYQAFTTQLQPEGAPSWQVRFTPTEAGAWRAQAELTQPKLTSKSLTFSVAVNAKARGFVRVHPEIARYFAFDNGDLYFPIGLNIAWSTGDVLKDYERWFDRLSANGGNVARIWMASWSFALEWNDTGLGDYSNRMKQAWLLDQVFKLAEERGIYIMLTLLNHGAFSTSVNPEWADNPYNVANGGMLKRPDEFVTNGEAKELFKRRLRYIAARWGSSPHLFAWEWWNEINWTPITDAQLEPWIAEMTKTLTTYDPYDHLRTHSYAAGSGSPIWAMSELSFAQQHDYSGSDLIGVFTDANRGFDKNAGDKPRLVGELGNTASGENWALDPEAIHLHNGLWAAPFTGYAGGAMYWWWDNYIDPNNLWPHFKGLHDFFEGEDLTRLTATLVTVSTKEATALALQGEEHALLWVRSNGYTVQAVQEAYDQAVRAALKAKRKFTEWRYEPPVLSTISVTLTGLQDGAYTVRWYSPTARSWGKEERIQVKNGTATLTIPSLQRDLAAKVVRVP